MKKTFKEILLLPYSVIGWQKDTDMIRISYPTERGLRSQSHRRDTWEQNGFSFDMRQFNGGTGGRKKLPESEKRVAVVTYHEKWKVDIINALGNGVLKQTIEDTVTLKADFYKSLPKI